ncbi:MAG: sigma-70 family RNA polymerase sigma factor [Planctomycetes bacterium]|nr:sigma-70 family RNA polymerase sigma factor [Planctomycetota bacterium]MCP4770335.1 sigma-70 family RNA polymerase sigma factor [Planctomycetota bacterium]MCP4861915.1 sigma-70 family RNA polymerase sigma factor [Planctomycetota bacterium]
MNTSHTPPSEPSTDAPAPVTKYEAEIDQWRHLVWYVVNRIKPRLPVSVSEDELFAAGMYGLMRAARSYDASRGAGFKTYAYHRIRGSILDDLRRLDFLPRSMRDKARANGTEPPSMVAIPTDEDGHESLAAQAISQKAEAEDIHQLLHRAIDDLPDKMRIVMSLYYREGIKMRDIGERLALTESRVSQIHSNAVTRLRRSMRSANGEV